MSTTRGPLAAIALLVCLSALAAAADEIPRLKDTTITAAAPLDASQQAEIRQFLDRWLPHLTGPADDRVSEARDALAYPLGPNASSHFLVEYRSALGRLLSGAFKSDRLIVRVNVMILAAALHEVATIDLLGAGVQDQSAAVRYWASKAIARLNDANPAPAPAEQDRLLQALTQALAQEKVEPVVQQLIQALGGLKAPAAVPRRLEAIDRRVEAHARDPGLALVAEIQGLRGVISGIVQRVTAGEPVPAEHGRLFTRVCARYALLCGTLLDEKRVPASTRGDYHVMVREADANLRWVLVRVLNVPESALPPSVGDQQIDTLIIREDWPSIRHRADAWVNLLVTKLDFKPQELTVQAHQSAGGAAPGTTP